LCGKERAVYLVERGEFGCFEREKTLEMVSMLFVGLSEDVEMACDGVICRVSATNLVSRIEV